MQGFRIDAKVDFEWSLFLASMKIADAPFPNVERSNVVTENRIGGGTCRYSAKFLSSGYCLLAGTGDSILVIWNCLMCLALWVR